MELCSQDGQTGTMVRNRSEYSRAKDKVRKVCCEEVEEECVQARYIARET